jgi:Rad3-related DNA helicase
MPLADYNYVFDPGAALSHLDREGLASAVLLIDEAHNLPDRARKIFSPELLQEGFRNVAGRLLLQPGELFEALSRIVEEAAALLQTTAGILEESAPIGEVQPPVAELREFVETVGAGVHPLPFLEDGKSSWPWRKTRWWICISPGSASWRS